MKTTKTIAKIAGAVLAGMMALSLASCNEKNGGSSAASADGLTKAQAKLLKGKPAPEADFGFYLSDDGSYVTITHYKGKAKEVVIPSTIQGLPVKALKAGFGWELTGVVIPEGVEYLFSGFARHKNLTTVVLPSTLKVIGEKAFEDCEKLATINLPEGLVYIDAMAFMGAGLTSVTLPKSLKGIGLYAFKDCDSLAEINIPDGHSIINLDINDDGTYLVGGGSASSFSNYFSGEKIKESVALQKLLKDTKTKAVNLDYRKYKGTTWEQWDW